MNKKHDWVQLIGDYNVSGFTQKEFCHRQELDLEQFKWRLRLSRREAKPLDNFIQLALAAPEKLPPAVELHFPDGLFLRFVGDVGTEYLRDLIVGMRS